MVVKSMTILPEMSWSLRSMSPEHIEKIISGGQTGVDRAANVVGPRESKNAGNHRQALEFLREVFVGVN